MLGVLLFFFIWRFETRAGDEAGGSSSSNVVGLRCFFLFLPGCVSRRSCADGMGGSRE